MVLFSDTFTDDFVTFVAPPPHPKPRSLAIVSPFPVVVWICIAATIALTSLVMAGIARAEGKITHMAYSEWTDVRSTFG